MQCRALPLRGGECYSRAVAAETKALLIALNADVSACVATINRLTPEHLCFFIPEALRPQIETNVQPNLVKLPQKWDGVGTPDPQGFGACYSPLHQPLTDSRKVWGLGPGVF